MYNGSITVRWASNSEPDLAGYKVYVGSSPQHYDRVTTTTGLLQIVPGLDSGQPWYCAVTAYDVAGNESQFSGEASKVVTVPMLALTRAFK